MTRRHQGVERRALIAAVESNTNAIERLSVEVTVRLDMIEQRLDATMAAVNDHINDPGAHGEQR